MNTLLPSLHPGILAVVYASHAAREPVSVLIAELALLGPLTVLDGGNRFQPYRVAHLLRQKIVSVDQVARQVFVRRAFTCYQMQTLLDGTPSLRQPYIVHDLLATFYDEQVPVHEARRLLEACLRQVDRLVQFAPVLVTLAPPLLLERTFLVEMIYARAQHVLIETNPVQPASQLALFVH